MKIVSTNPSNGYSIIGEVEATSAEDVRTTVARARAAQPDWAALTQDERNAAIHSFALLLEKHEAELTQLMSEEMGKPIRAARQQMRDTVEYFEGYTALAEAALEPETVYEDAAQRHIQTREPLGVIACIAPWNFPLLNIPWQCGQALLAGNAVIYKPSEEVALFAQLLRSLVEQSSLPEGVFTVLVGDGAVGELLAEQPVDAISFTGSTRTGQRITELAATHSTRVLTEMGGSSPGIVFEDADVPSIINTIYLMRYDNTGQYCDGLKRLIVHTSKYDEVVDELKKLNATKKIGPALDETTDFGPLVAERQLKTLEAQVADAVGKGATVVFGGKQPRGLSGAYYEPTLLTNIRPDMRVWKEEVFGPVLPIVTFETEVDAVELANDTTYGLTAYVFTQDSERYRRVARQLEAGAIAHNNALYFSTKTPFGGYKSSGNSRTNGIAGFLEVTQIKIVCEEKA